MSREKDQRINLHLVYHGRGEQPLSQPPDSGMELLLLSRGILVCFGRRPGLFGGHAEKRVEMLPLDLDLQPAFHHPPPLPEHEDGYKLFCHHFFWSSAAESACLVLAWFR